MGAIIDEQEIKCSIPAGRLFKAFVVNSDKILPEILPGIFKSFETIEGDEGVGCMQLVTFAQETQIMPAKHRIEEIDEVNHKSKYSLIEGGILGEDFESISYDIKIEASQNDIVSIITIVTTYRPKRDNHHSIQEKIKQSQERTEGFVRTVEAHLHGNPNEYN